MKQEAKSEINLSEDKVAHTTDIFVLWTNHDF